MGLNNRLPTFSPDGRILQIEYAIEAVRLGSTVIGIRSNSCAILALEKKKEGKLTEEYGVQKLVYLRKTIGCGVSGLTSDARFIIEKIRVFLENNFFNFLQTPSIESCAKKIRDLMLFPFSTTEREVDTCRPPGAAFLLCGWDSCGIQLFQVDPSGNSVSQDIAALGGGFKEAIFIIKEGFRKNMSTGDTKVLAVKALRVIMEDQINETKFEIGFIEQQGKNFKLEKPENIKKILKKI
mmetsp:Transcript_14839/g.29801  ORF Transcript_14839/g.29801 Transcript_14839/m.29801 type:complete len:238 (+) Transcript_14839:118-831(+)